MRIIRTVGPAGLPKQAPSEPQKPENQSLMLAFPYPPPPTGGGEHLNFFIVLYILTPELSEETQGGLAGPMIWVFFRLSFAGLAPYSAII